MTDTTDDSAPLGGAQPQAAYPPGPYGQPATPHAVYGYGVPPQPGQAAQGTNGFSIAALILGIVGVWPLALIFGFIARSQTRRTGQQGRGMALTGIILGVVGAVLSVLLAVLIATSVNNAVNNFNSSLGALPGSSVPAASGQYPQSARDAFMGSCEGAGGVSYCQCVLNRLEATVPFNQFAGMASQIASGTMPQAMQDAATSCTSKLGG